MPRKSGTSKPKNFAFSEEAHIRRYNPSVQGYGTPKQTRAAFFARMGFEEATRIKDAAGSAWRSEYKIISEMAGPDAKGNPVELNDKSMWAEIQLAFRKAAMNCHPDRMTQHGKSKIDPKTGETQAEIEFKKVSAAYAILAHKYGED
jgi:hypothetical protein